MNTCYYVNNRSEIAAIRRDGFSCNHENKETITGRIGVFLQDYPGVPEPDYPDDQLLEITLPPGIELSKFEMDAPGARCREWLIPAHLLNQSAKFRLLSKEQWQQVGAAARRRFLSERRKS